MKILVCIKPITESTSANMPRSQHIRMNRFDEFALEEALMIREAAGNVSVEAISVGPEQSVQVLRRAMGMGADRCIHILTTDDPFRNAFSTASLIAEYARNKQYDLILTGAISEDLMQGQVGPMLAEMLSLPSATAVISTRLSLPYINVEREIEGGSREAWEIRLPAVLSIQTGINKPRYPSLSQMLRAAKSQPEIIREESLGKPRIRQIVADTDIARKQRSGLVLTGNSEQKAAALITIFRDKGFLK